jgi:Flp pilus assembly secretin CpaC/tetratricopeptide (TPR) repeat protein
LHTETLMKRAGVVMTLAVFLLMAGPVRAADDAQSLRQAVELYNQGEYLEAQELLAGLDRSKLNADDQALRDDYLDRTRVAISMAEKAGRDLEDAEMAEEAAAAATDPAVKEQELASARRLLETVLANEYAPPAMRNAAISRLRALDGEAAPEADAPVMGEIEISAQPAVPPADAQSPEESAAVAAPQPTAEDVERARARVTEGDTMLSAGRYDEAERLYTEALAYVPGYPDAQAGLDAVVKHRANIYGTPAESLADKLRKADELNWQRSEQLFRSTERDIRAHIAANRYNDAGTLLTRAGQIVEAAKQYADPVSKYENLRADFEALRHDVADAQRVYEASEVARVRAEVEQQRNVRKEEIEANRQREIDSLMNQAKEHRMNGDLESAIGVLKQVLAMDPNNMPARWLLDSMEEDRNFRKQRELHSVKAFETLKTLVDVELSKIPWSETVTYPKDWPERISRPERNRPGSTVRDSLLSSALEKHVPVDFPNQPFGQVIEALVDTHNLNIIVDWNDLKLAGIDADVPISLRLPREVTLKKVLTEVLDQAGGGVVDLGYDIHEGVISVATQKRLDNRTYTAVYDISDLLMEVPNFTDAPMTDLATASRPKPVRTYDSMPWRQGDDDDDDLENDPARRDRVREIISLIQDVISQNSWRETGGTIGTIREINSQLVVTQNSATQQQIGGLLDKLREQRAIQIGIEARFLTIASHYLEEFGIDLDIVLNSGNAGFDIAPTRATGDPIATDPVLGSRLLVPRSVSRVGFGPAVPALGAATENVDGINQPYTNPTYVPSGRSGGSNLSPVPVQSGVLNYSDPSRITHDIPGTFAGKDTPPALNIFGSFLDNIQVDFLIRATQADSRNSVLTAPRIVLFNGQRSWVAVTVQTNFVSQLLPVVATAAAAQAPQTGTINAGAVLDVQGTVTSDKRYVTMTLRPGVTRLNQLSTFQTSGGGTAGDAFVQLPELSSQLIKTTVTVPDSGTLLIGGQKLAAETEVDSGVPGLSKIPVLKRLYSSRVLVKDEQTLLILVKPTIFIQSEQEEQAFPSFSNRN